MSNNKKKEIESLRFSVEFDEPLRSVFLEECESEERDMASNVRWIVKRHYLALGRISRGQTQLPKGGSDPRSIPHFGDDDDGQGRESQQGQAD